jgi:hypothetical protein
MTSDQLHGVLATTGCLAPKPLTESEPDTMGLRLLDVESEIQSDSIKNLIDLVTNLALQVVVQVIPFAAEAS